MRIQIVLMGLTKNLNISAGTTLNDLKEKLKDKNLNTFYKRDKILASDYVLQEGDTIIGVAKNQQPKLG